MYRNHLITNNRKRTDHVSLHSLFLNFLFYILGHKDSNLEMLESESSALPFGDGPSLPIQYQQKQLYSIEFYFAILYGKYFVLCKQFRNRMCLLSNLLLMDTFSYLTITNYYNLNISTSFVSVSDIFCNVSTASATSLIVPANSPVDADVSCVLAAFCCAIAVRL